MRGSAAVQAPEAACDNRTGLPAVEALARAARQIALYGPDHPISGSSLREAWREISSAANRAEVLLQVEEGHLQWNRQPVLQASVHVARLHQALRDRLVSAIRFTGSLESADLARLLQVLAEDPHLLLPSGGVMQAFGPEAASLCIEDMDLSRDLRECEAAWIEVCEEIDPSAVEPLRRILETCLHLVRSVGEHRTLEEIRAATAEPVPLDLGELSSPTEAIAAILATLIQSAGEIARQTGTASQLRWQTAILQQLEALGPQWSAAIFRAPVPASPGGPDILALLMQSMSFERRLALVLDFPGRITTERSQGLALILQRLLSHAEEAFALERGLHDRAIAEGVPEEVYRNVVGMLMPDLTTTRRAEGLPRVMQSVGTPTADPSAELADLMATLDPRQVRRSRVYMLLDMLDEELNASQYASVVRALLEMLQRSARNSDGELLVQILERLLKDTEEHGGQTSGRRAIAEAAVARSIDGQVIDLTLRELGRRGAEPRAQVVALLGRLGDLGRQALVDLVRRSHEVDGVEALRVLTERDAPAFSHLRQLLAELPLIDLERTVRTLVRLSPPLLGVPLDVVATHPDVHARLALTRAVGEAHSAAGGEVVVRLLSDPSAEVRTAAARVLGALGLPDAVPGLCFLLGRESDLGAGAEVKAAAAQALGEIRSPEAVPALAEFLFSGGLLARFCRRQPREAAVEALRRIGGLEARRVLEDWRRCPQPGVRDLCLRALAEMTVRPQPARRVEERRVS